LIGYHAHPLKQIGSSWIGTKLLSIEWSSQQDGWFTHQC